MSSILFALLGDLLELERLGQSGCDIWTLALIAKEDTNAVQ
jgi:hypothetical protein